MSICQVLGMDQKSILLNLGDKTPKSWNCVCTITSIRDILSAEEGVTVYCLRSSIIAIYIYVRHWHVTKEGDAELKADVQEMIVE